MLLMKHNCYITACCLDLLILTLGTCTCCHFAACFSMHSPVHNRVCYYAFCHSVSGILEDDNEDIQVESVEPVLVCG